VEVRGGAPGTRETGVFTPGNLVNEIHGLVFSGGSAFGLAAADGVAQWLAGRNVGFPVGAHRVPIVAGAVLFDLAVGEPRHPDREMGIAACRAAREARVETGPVGAGTGATVGKLFGIDRAAPGGVGAAAVRLPGGELVAALAAVNAFGDVADPETGRIVAGPVIRGRRTAPTARALQTNMDLIPFGDLTPGGATTLVCVATTAAFEPGALKRVAIEAHDGIARAVRPAHTIVDGDAVFALAPSGSPPPILLRLRVGAAAAEAVARAIVAAVRKRS
jgi:L-aminopeptidase/D-esterase-like protein